MRVIIATARTLRPEMRGLGGNCALEAFLWDRRPTTSSTGHESRKLQRRFASIELCALRAVHDFLIGCLEHSSMQTPCARVFTNESPTAVAEIFMHNTLTRKQGDEEIFREFRIIR